ncbi:thermonuclease family protein [Actinomadura sp. 21ATH]|uniref:thermonuclease family protein n=1 Tax=Actinomadura sp. 21ATH TaxID=1735444 RepID=UPI0035BFCBEB
MVAFDFPRTVRRAEPRRLIEHSDGDTPVIRQPIRMVSVDTPEKAQYAGRPPAAQRTLDRCRDRLAGGTFDRLVPAGLRDHLLERLTPDAAERHIAAAERATAHFADLRARRLARPGREERSVGVVPTGELIDRYGRLLAYLAPWYAGGAKDPLPRRDHPDRRTFNLDMVAAGWGAMFLVYPSLPGGADLRTLLDEAHAAWTERRGMWAEFGADLLLAYEYRACVKLGAARMEDPKAAVDEAYRRICVDLDGPRVLGPYDYHRTPPSRRLWIWREDLDRAREDLDLPPG